MFLCNKITFRCHCFSSMHQYNFYSKHAPWHIYFIAVLGIEKIAITEWFNRVKLRKENNWCILASGLKLIRQAEHQELITFHWLAAEVVVEISAYWWNWIELSLQINYNCLFHLLFCCIYYSNFKKVWKRNQLIDRNPKKQFRIEFNQMWNERGFFSILVFEKKRN